MANIQSEYLKTKNGVQLMTTVPYPIGAIYLSVDSTNPGQLFGGTWVQIKDRFLLACGDTYANGDTGGDATHALTVDEIPSHNHWIKYNTTGSGYAMSEVMSARDTATTTQGSSAGGVWQVSSTKTGGGQSHNNMPPYLAVYVWKRTA